MINVVECENGDKFWYKNGLLHREDGPAREYADGDKYWYLNGILHREYGPAIERLNYSKEWYKNRERHREDGPAIEYANGNKLWYKNDILYKVNDHNINNNKCERCSLIVNSYNYFINNIWRAYECHITPNCEEVIMLNVLS